MDCYLELIFMKIVILFQLLFKFVRRVVSHSVLRPLDCMYTFLNYEKINPKPQKSYDFIMETYKRGINQCQCCYKLVNRKEFIFYLVYYKGIYIVKTHIIEKYRKLKVLVILSKKQLSLADFSLSLSMCITYLQCKSKNGCTITAL